MEQAVREKRIRLIPATKEKTPTGGPSGRKLRVAAYCRVSTDNEEQLTSYTSQKEYYTQKIGENPDWEFAGIFADRGITGTSMKKRAEFNRMIAACKRGRIDLILTKSLSRFARNTVDCLATVRMLRGRGIAVHFEKENINTLTEAGEFMITLFSGFAQAESESIRNNVIWGILKSREAGNVPFQYTRLLGYRRGADGEPEIDAEEAEVVRRIYRRYLDGASIFGIQRELEQEHVPTATGVKQWSWQTIHNILINEGCAERKHEERAQDRRGKRRLRSCALCLCPKAPEIIVLQRFRACIFFLHTRNVKLTELSIKKLQKLEKQ